MILLLVKYNIQNICGCVFIYIKKNLHNITIPVNRVIFLQNVSPVTYTNLKHSISEYTTPRLSKGALTN